MTFPLGKVDDGPRSTARRRTHAPDPHRRPAPSPAGRWPDLRAAALRAEALGYDIVYTWDHFFPLYGDRDGPHFECWSMLAALGRGDRAGSRSGRSSPATRTATRSCSPTWPDRRPHQRRPGDPRHRRRLVTSATTTSTATSSGRSARGSRRSARPHPADPSASRALEPPPVRRIPLLIAGAGERRTLAARRALRGRLARGVPGATGGAGAGGGRPAPLVRRDRARPDRDRVGRRRRAG